MRDNFKKYIDQNAEAFDYSFNVEEGMADFRRRQGKNRPSRRLYMAAASITVVIALSAGIIYSSQKEEVDSEWTEVANYYEDQIDNMTRVVMNLTDDQEILNDLEQIDKAFAEVKADLKDDAANQEVIEAMMNHYRLKLSILEKMLEEINKTNENEDISRL